VTLDWVRDLFFKLIKSSGKFEKELAFDFYAILAKDCFENYRRLSSGFALLIQSNSFSWSLKTKNLINNNNSVYLRRIWIYWLKKNSANFFPNFFVIL